MKLFFSSLFLLIFASTTLSSQDNLRSELNKTLDDYELTQLDIKSLYQKVSTANKFQITRLEVGGQTFDLELINSGMRSEGDIVRLASGAIHKGTPPIPMKGIVKNDLGSSVRLTVNENFLYGYIKTDKGTLHIEPAWYFDNTASKDLIVSYYATDTKALEHPGTCELHTHTESLKNKTKNQIRNTNRQVGDCFVVDIALAADWLMTDLFGSVGDVDDQICGVLNDVQGNYDDEFADVVEFDLVDVFISDCNTCDPWTSSTNSSTLLNSFTNWGPSGFSSHDVATLWSARDFNGSTIGVAWLGGTCTGSRYNICEHFTGNSNLLRVLQAHELGHNFDAEHDSGGGLIMSTSVNNTTAWSSDSEDDIEDFLQNATCFGTCSSGSPPTANFQFEVIEECAAGEVDFEDLSGLASEWFWTFDGGTPSTSTEQNPTVIYNSPGTFDVTLEVTNASGEDEFEWEDAIVIFDGPIVDFDIDDNELEIDFFDESSASGSAEYFWDFGDGNDSEEQNPTHLYAAPGTYTVTFEVEDDCGFDSFTQDIEVYDNPEADFVGDNLVICRNDQVIYTDLSYGNIDEWDWEFEGAVPSNSDLENPTVVYNIAGTYTTSLDVENIEGDDDITRENYITVLADAEAGFNFTANGATVTFTSTSINQSSIMWDFGDGNSSTDANPTHTYVNSGDYTVTLTVSNQCNTDISTDVVSIQLQPVAAFSANQVTNGCADYTINFNDNSSSSPTSWNWSFPGGTPSSSTLQNPTVTYTQRGVFTVSLISSNSFGSSTSTMTDLVTIDDLPELSASFTENLLSVQFNSTVNFQNSILWNFGDGNTSNLASPTHTYATAGNYTATVTATNACGSVSQEFNLNVDLLPSANITSNSTSVCEGDIVSYSNNSNSNVTAWNWSFPGGTPATSTLPNPTVTYNTAGTYDASLVVTNSAGQGNSTVTDFIDVTARPDLTFTSNENENLLELTNTTPGTSVEWVISDGTTSSLQAWTHRFASNGTYTVTVTTTNQCGSDTESFNVTIDAFPTASFTTSQTTGCTPLQVNYTSGATNATSYNWSFPGGTPSSSTEANPIVIYNTEGTFDASLTVSNTIGSDISTMTQLVSVATLEPLSFDSQLNGNVVELSNTTPNTQTSWIISDGATSSLPNYTHTFQENGTFEVTLQVSNACGTEETTFTVVVDALTSAAFSVSNQTSGCTPLQVFFTSDAPNATSYNWSFPGGNPTTSTIANPTVVYNTDGVFDVSLTVSNAFGSDMTTMSQFISVATLEPLSFDSDQNNNVLSLNNTTPNTETLWTISDGTTSTDANYMHTFNSNGTFTVTLLVSNSCGSEETSFDVTISNLPEVGFQVNSATEGCLPFEVTFESTAVNADNHNWSFPGGQPATSTEANPTVVYTTVGLFDVSLEVSNAFGTVQDSQAELISVGDVPTVDFTILSQDMGDISFTSQIVGATSFLWNFGDGNTSTEENPSHTYDMAGTYTVTLEATNICGTVFFEETVIADIISDVEDLIVDAWRLAPNPSSGILNLSFDAPTTERLTYEIVDLAGRKLYTKNLDRGATKDELTIDQPGVYLFVITQNSSREVRRLVIMQ